jgi:dTDP-4-dehydrorhamnose reductase
MKILVVGHRGMLGSDLMIRFTMAGHDATGKDIDELDITSREACREAIEEAAPDAVVNAAAFTNVDACESARDGCFAVNARGIGNLALACRDRGAGSSISARTTFSTAGKASPTWKMLPAAP